MTVTLEEFEDTKGSVNADERGRVALGTSEKNKTYAISRNSVGQILLTPIATIPEYEIWLWRNPAALASVRQGLEDAAAGRVHSADFTQYADLEMED